MFGNLKLDVRSVDSYDLAAEALKECCQRGRRHRESDHPGGPWMPLGHKRAEVTTVRRERDDSIAFRLYNTDVVTWHPDNSVTVVPWSSQLTATFARRFLPSGLSLKANSMMTYFPVTDTDPTDWNRRVAARMCRAAGTYRQDDAGAWLPDLDTIRPMRIYSLDRKRTREICKRFPFAKFKLWLEIACDHIDVQWGRTNAMACAEALEQGKFREAARWLPTVQTGKGFGVRDRLKPLNLIGTNRHNVVTLTSVDYLRRWIYETEGALEVSEVTTMSCAQFEQQYRLRRDYENAGAYIG